MVGPSGRRPLRFPVRSVALIVSTIAGLYGFLLLRGEGRDLLRAVSGMPQGVWGQVIALSCLSYLARFYRWHRFLVMLGHRVSVLVDIRIYLAGFALTLTPAKAGETVRSLYLRPFGVPFPDSLAAFVCERLTDLLVVGGIACLSLRAFPEHAWLGVWGLGGCIVFALALRHLTIPALVARVLGRAFGAHVAGVVRSMRRLLVLAGFAGALPLTLIAWTAQGLALYLVVSALGHSIDPVSVIGVYCVAILAGAISFIPGGLGATEGAIVFLLVATGVPAPDAVLAALITRGLTLWLAVLIGLVATATLAVTAPGANEG